MTAAGYTIELPDSTAKADAPTTGYTIEPPDEPSFWDRALESGHQLLRGAGLADRNVLHTLMTPVTFPLDVGIHGINTINSGIKDLGLANPPRYPNASQMLDTGLTALGVAEPETPAERIVSAMTTAGMSAGGAAQLAQRYGPGAADQVARYIAQTMAKKQGMQVAAGATGGGASQATAEAGGGPIAQAIAGVAGSLIPQAGVAAAEGAMPYVTRAAPRAAQKLIDTLGGPDEARAAVGAVRDYAPGAPVEDIPMSTGEILQDPRISGLERNARMRFKEGWAGLTQTQAEMRYNALRDATAGADTLEKAAAARDAATGPIRTSALAAAGKTGNFAQPVADHITELLAGDSGANPAVQKVAAYVSNELNNNMTPGRLYEVRKVLQKGLSGPLNLGTDKLSAAMKNAERETLGIMHAIDASLDQASGGSWSKYLQTYGERSAPVTSGLAEQGIRDVFEREGAPMLPTGGGGAVPEVTGFRLGKAIDKFGSNSFGDTLSGASREALARLQGNIQRSELLQKLLRLTGTSGGGPTTAMDLGSNVAMENAPSGTLGTIANWTVGRSKYLLQGALSDALQNPDLFVQGIERKLMQAKRPTFSEMAVLNAMRGMAVNQPQMGTQ